MCCPPPQKSVIQPEGGSLKHLRSGLKMLIYGELLACCLKMILFDPFTGLIAAVAIWIDYMGYATMHFCQCLIITFCGSLDLLMLLMNYSRSASYKALYDSSTFSRSVFWYLIVFESVKILISMAAFRRFRVEFYR